MAKKFKPVRLNFPSDIGSDVSIWRDTKDARGDKLAEGILVKANRARTCMVCVEDGLGKTTLETFRLDQIIEINRRILLEEISGFLFPNKECVAL
jgi:hypothetical protein